MNNRFRQKAIARVTEEKRLARKQGEAILEAMRIINERKREAIISKQESMEGVQTEDAKDSQGTVG